MKSTLEILREARALYAASPSHVPSSEQPADGTHCPITAVQAVQFEDSTVTYGHILAADLALAAAAPCVVDDIPRWNAGHTTAEVLAAWDRAIAAEEAKA